MFLWVNLMLEEISKKPRPSEIRAKLDDAPRDLAKMIRHVFERLAKDEDISKEDLNLMLGWVACAERPLVLGELDVNLKLRPPVGEGYPALEDDLRGQFASFFDLSRADGQTTEDLQRRAEQASKVEQESYHEDEREGSTRGDDDDDEEFVEEPVFQSDPKDTTIQFSHASIRDYLRREGLPADIGKDLSRRYTNLGTELLTPKGIGMR